MFTCTRLTTARKRRGWTLARLADEVGLSTKSLSSYENGHQNPSPATVELLARTLAVAPTFFAADDVDEIPLDAVSFRALSKMTARTRDRGLACGRIALMINAWIEDRFDLPAADLPTLTGHDPEVAAHEVRARWGLGEQPIGNVVHLLESRGVRVYSLTHDNADLDAFCLFWQSRPFVFLSTQKSAERGRFDAAHELGHLILHGGEHTPHGLQAEQDANRFAAALLMPASGVLAQGVRNAGVEQILLAKTRWNVSAMAMTHRVNELGLMSEWNYRTVCIDLARLGYRRSEPDGGPRESSQLLTKVLQQLRSRNLGLADLATDLGLGTEEVRSHLFGLTPTVIAGGGQGTSAGRRHLRVLS